MSNGIDQDALRSELARTWTTGSNEAEEAEAKTVIADLVKSWAAEADSTPNPEAVLKFQRRDLEAAGDGKSGAERLDVLRRELLRRRVDQLGASTFALGIEILDGKVEPDDGKARGRALLTQAEDAGRRLSSLPQTDETAAIRRELSDAVMEALFAVESKALSARLDRERQSRWPKSGGSGVGPPTVR